MVSGNILKPSDQRVKKNITPVETAVQLKHVENLTIYDYDLKTIPGKRERGGANNSILSF